ncbi:MAG: ABC transporter ATP-binding protein [Rhodospirillales bacterium]
MDTHEPILKVDGIRVSYGKKEILQGVDFAIAPGETLCLLGANGSGKSTAMNAISGFVGCTHGKIELDGGEIQNMPAHKTFRLGMVQVSQARDLFPQLTVEDNLKLGAQVRSKSTMPEELERVYNYFPRLRERRTQRVMTLSGGEQQMVAIGRAVMARPRVLLLDEPSGGLSPQFVNEIGSIIAALKEDGATMLMIEQNLGLAFKVADRFIILRDGIVVDGGTVADYADDHEQIVKSIYL